LITVEISIGEFCVGVFFMPSLEVNGNSFFYDENGAGETIIFCHGIPTDYRAWDSQTSEFSKKFRTISYSRRYAAPNKKEGNLADSTIGNNASDLKGLIEKLGGAPVHLVGHSYGGFIAAYFAADHQDLVHSLVLVEPAISTMLLEKVGSVSQMISLLLRSPSVALSARRFITESLNPCLKALDEGQFEKAVELNIDGLQERKGAFASMPIKIKEMMMQNARTLAEQRTVLPPFKSLASKISCPTFVLNGEDGAIWLKRIGELTAAAVQKGQLAKVPSSGHFPHMENPSKFNDLLKGFLSMHSQA
jgi:pimeloyl-ACP methyl ester carboxylesterase